MGYDAHDDPQHIGGSVFMNPGTGPVQGATLENAAANMLRLVEDAGIEDAHILHIDAGEDAASDGRYPFEVTAPASDRLCTVDMPGLPLDQVRYMNEADQNIWHFPRLYVDGSSWVWCYAISSVHRSLMGEDEDDA
jgi:hypothetical protein